MRISLKKKLSLIFLSCICLVCFAFAIIPFVKVEAEEITPSKKVELYQLAPSENLYEGYVIKTLNDELIVIDGGASTGTDAPYIDSALTAIAGKEDYTVKYWFLSHAHTDHIYELAKILNYDTIDFTIENIVFDFPEFVNVGTEDSPSYKYGNCDLGGDSTAWFALQDGLDNYAEKKGITVSGDSYYDDLNGKVINSTVLADGPKVIEIDEFITIEVLQTWSDRDTQVNSNSMVMRFYIDGQSVLFLNDATVESGNRLIETYGREYLKSDIVQMAHHGQNGTAKNVYDAVQAKVRLWPCHSGIWENTGGGYQTDEVRSWVGVEKITENNEYDFVSALSTMPSDKTSVSAWEEVLDTMKMELPYLPVYESAFAVNKGASIRLNEGSTGIRFSATLATYDKDAEYGFVIVPRQTLDNLGVSENYVSALINKYGTGEDGVGIMKSAVHQVGGHFEIKGGIANILDQNVNLEFVGLAYAYKDGVYIDATIPSSFDDISRSVAEVATSAYNDSLYNANSDYFEDNTAQSIMTGFINKATGGEEYSLAFANTTETLTVFESKELEVVSNVDMAYADWSSDDESVVTVEDGIITAVGVGTANITVKSAGKTATCAVTSEAETDAIVSFSNKASENIVRDVPPEIRASRRSGGLVEGEWLESYAGANGVLKVTSKAGVSSPYVADIRIELPVEITDGATIKFMITDSDAKFFYFYEGGNDNTTLKTYYASNDTAISDSYMNSWQVLYVPYDSSITDRSAINILIQGGSAQYEHVFYIDIITEGNVVADMTVPVVDANMSNLASKLNEPSDLYLADFSEEGYEKLVGNQKFTEVGHSDSSLYVASSLTAEWIDKDEEMGETNLLKVTVTTTNGGFSLRLPKSIGSNGFTIRFMIAEMSDDTMAIFQILNPYTNATSKYEIYDSGSTQTLSANIGVWQTQYITAYNSVPSGYEDYANNYVDFRLYTKTSSKKVIYIDYVGAGDCAEQVIAEKTATLAGELEDPYLADFSSSAYTYLADYSTNSVNKATSLSAGYVDSYTDDDGSIEYGVLQVTAKAQSNGRGNIVINLPKSSTSGTVTVKFMIPTCNSSYVYFIEPGTNADTKSISLGVSTTWQYVTFTQTATDSIELLFANSGAVTNVAYFACIAEGDQVDYLKEQAISQTKTYLKDNLDDGYLADFSKKGYELLLADDPYGSTSIAKTKIAEYVANYDNGTEDDTTDDVINLLRITTTNNNSKYGDFAINLPKEITNGFTIKFKIEATSGSVFRILKPGSQTGKVYELANTSLTNAVGGDWITVNITLPADYTVNDQVVFQFWGGTTDTTNTIIIDYIMEYNG